MWIAGATVLAMSLACGGTGGDGDRRKPKRKRPAPAEPAPKPTPKPAPPDSELDKPGPCSSYAYVVDTDPAGLNVRAGPGTSHDVLGTLPQDTIVHIRQSRSGWVRVTDPAVEVSRDPDHDPPAAGWVSAKLLGVDFGRTAYPRGYAELHGSPTSGSPVVGKMKGTATLMGCSTDWLQVHAGRTKGWLAHDEQCGNPVTTCP